MEIRREDNEYILEMVGITKLFPGVKALDDVSFNLKKGEVHAIAGENGAGKSTLMKILGGVYSPDAGEIRINGKKTVMTCARDALNNSISIVYQELNLIPTLTVAENIFLGKEIKGKIASVDRKAMCEETKKVLHCLGIEDLDGTELVKSMSVAKQQLVEIAKSLHNNANIIVMDEPTAVLTPKETGKLFEVIRKFKDDGISVIYISHRLEEVVNICDRITVLRDGKYITTLDNRNRDTEIQSIIKHMVGRSLTDYFPKRKAAEVAETILEVRNLTRNGVFHDVSFQLNKGEILGLSGLVGAGRSEVAEAIFGCEKCDSGEVLVEGKRVNITSVKDAIDAGISLVPEDRKRQGLVLDMTLAENTVLPNLSGVSTAGTIRRLKCKTVVNKAVSDLSIRPALPDRAAKDFSGGNQQKIVIAKWLAKHPRIMILDEPTRGIDVGGKKEIYSLIEAFADKGVGVIVISSEMIELLGICDRIITLCNGRVTGNIAKKDATEEILLEMAVGVSPAAG